MANKLIKFSQPNCRGCVVMNNVIEEVEPKIYHKEIDISTHPDFVSNYTLTGVPTMIVVNHEGLELARHIGTMTEDEFADWISDYEDGGING
jgi:hypothetical protein